VTAFAIDQMRWDAANYGVPSRREPDADNPKFGRPLPRLAVSTWLTTSFAAQSAVAGTDHLRWTEHV
jgi:hypothetical protein